MMAAFQPRRNLQRLPARRRGRVLIATAVAMLAAIFVLALSLNVVFRPPPEMQLASVQRAAPPYARQDRVPLPPHDGPPSAWGETSPWTPKWTPATPAPSIVRQFSALFVPGGKPADGAAWRSQDEPMPAVANTAPLVDQIEQLRRRHPNLQWPVHVLLLLERINSTSPAEQADALDELAFVARPELLEIESFADDAQRRELLAVCRAAARRAAIWRRLHAIAARQATGRRTPGVNTYAMWVQIQEALDAIPYPQSRAWREYLRFDQLEAALGAEPATRDQLAGLALDVLERLHSPALDSRQRALLACAEVDRLESMLRQCVTRPVDVAAVVNAVEDFERSDAPADGRRLAELARRSRWSNDSQAAELARCIDELYRGPNVRICVSAELLNRLLGQTITDVAPIQQQTPQARIVGRRKADTDLAVRFVPAHHDLRLHLIADGQVSADTTVYSGPATFFVGGSGSFQSSKLLVFKPNAIDLAPAEATSQFGLQLNGYQTSVDVVPLVRRVARESALAQFQQQQAATTAQVQAEVRDEARQTLDRQTAEFVGAAQRRLQTHLLRPLESLGLDATPLRLCTTASDMRGEFRVAGSHHAAALSPPPAPPARSLLSVQLHDSAVNNLLDGLQLHGRRENLHALCRRLCGQFGVADPPLDEAAKAVTVQFADRQPLRVDFHDEGATLVLRLAEFCIGGKGWSNVTIRCTYTIDADSRRPLRIAALAVEGDSLSRIDRLLLTGVFTKVFSCVDELLPIDDYLKVCPGGEKLALTQCRVEDGWLAMAIGARP